MKRMVLWAAVMLAQTTAYAADDETLLGEWRDWSAMRYVEAEKPVCVMWTSPSKASDVARDADPHAFVSHRSKAQIFHEASIKVGVPLKVGSVLTARVGDQRFTLYSDGASAWNNALKEDLRMIRAMRAGRDLKVSATTAEGQKIKDTYSLFGFTDAHKRINKECGAKYR